MMILATYIVTGALAGFLAGLLGIGGGLIVVPVLVVSFTMQGFAPDVIMPLAVGTSLATIVVTSSISIRAHHARGNIDWRIFKPTAPGIFVGAVLGLTLSATAPTQLMQIAFVVYASFVALNLLTTPEMPAARRAVPVPRLPLQVQLWALCLCWWALLVHLYQSPSCCGAKSPRGWQWAPLRHSVYRSLCSAPWATRRPAQ